MRFRGKRETRGKVREGSSLEVSIGVGACFGSARWCVTMGVTSGSLDVEPEDTVVSAAFQLDIVIRIVVVRHR